MIRYGTEVRAVLKVKAKSNYAYLKKKIFVCSYLRALPSWHQLQVKHPLVSQVLRIFFDIKKHILFLIFFFQCPSKNRPLVCCLHVILSCLTPIIIPHQPSFLQSSPTIPTFETLIPDILRHKHHSRSTTLPCCLTASPYGSWIGIPLRRREVQLQQNKKLPL